MSGLLARKNIGNLFTGSSGKKARRRERKQFEGGSKVYTGIDPAKRRPITPGVQPRAPGSSRLGSIRTPLSVR